MTTSTYDYRTKAKQAKIIYNLRYQPTIMCSRATAFEWAAGMNKLHFVILGDDCMFWVVCPADALRLIKAGYEYAQ